MKIKQELLDNGFKLYYGDDIEIVENVLEWLEMNTNIICFNNDRATENLGDSLQFNTKLMLENNKIYLANSNYNDLEELKYDDLWEYDLDENIDKICKLDIDKGESQKLINAKQDIISLILDAQLSSGKRFDKFINDLPVEDEVLIDFIFADDDYDLLLSELLDVLNYLEYEMNTINKD